MKIVSRTTTLLLLGSTTTATAFVASSQQSSSSTSCLQATRRQFGNAAVAAAFSAVLVGAPNASNADVDYSRIQDLLGNSDSAVYVPQGGSAASPSKRPTYLTEPTAEFKENETKSSDFKRKNLQAKQKFITTMAQLETVPNSEDALAKVLDEMRYQVKGNGGLPTGITKEEVVKACRRRKIKKFWPTNVEIA